MTEVVVERDGERETYSADIVAVSCGAANSAKLLLASATDKHPNGLANGSDQVGRNYMFHNSQAILALSKEPTLTVFQKTLGLNDFDFASKEFDHPLGNIQMIGKSQAAMYRGEKPLETKLAPSWTLEKIAAPRRRLLAFDGGPAEAGQPGDARRTTGAIRLSYTYSNEKPKKELYDKLKSILGHIGMHEGHLLPHHAYLKNEIPVAGVAHQSGHLPLRYRSRQLGARHRLQGARARQPLRRRHELLPQHRRRQPGAHGDGQRPPGRGSPAQAPRRQRGLLVTRVDWGLANRAP